MLKVSNVNLKRMVSDRLINVGICRNYKGYDYLRYIIMEELQNPTTSTVAYHMTGKNGVYDRIARHFNTTPSRVDRAIRYAKEQSMYEVSYSTLLKYGIDTKRGIPNNSEYLSILIDELRMELESMDVSEEESC